MLCVILCVVVCLFSYVECSGDGFVVSVSVNCGVVLVVSFMFSVISLLWWNMCIGMVLLV